MRSPIQTPSLSPYPCFPSDIPTVAPLVPTLTSRPQLSLPSGIPTIAPSVHGLWSLTSQLWETCLVPFLVLPPPVTTCPFTRLPSFHLLPLPIPHPISVLVSQVPFCFVPAVRSLLITIDRLDHQPQHPPSVSTLISHPWLSLPSGIPTVAPSVHGFQSPSCRNCGKPALFPASHAPDHYPFICLFTSHLLPFLIHHHSSP